MRVRCLAVVAAAVVAAVTSHARAQTPVNPQTPPSPASDPDEVAGLVRRPVEVGDASRALAAVVLLPPRELFHLLFAGGEGVAEAGRRVRLVQRVDEMLFPPPGELALVPTVFFQTRHPVSFGGRLIGEGDFARGTLSVASGGFHDAYAATTLEVDAKRYDLEFDFDAMFDERDQLEFLGVGQDPDSDARNHYRADAQTHDALYLERRSRVAASVDYGITKRLHVVASGSLLTSVVRDATDAGASSLSRVFSPEAVVANAADTRIAYGELALAARTRRRWEGPDIGALAELYVGGGADVGGAPAKYIGVGGRGALFFPIVRETNTLETKLVFDAIDPLSDGFPFTALTRQPDYRGFDLRRDRLSVVATVDYRWVFYRYLAARAFVDVATVGPNITKMFEAVPSIAGGVGLDVFTHDHPLAQFGMSMSGDGPRVFVSFGWSPLGGDRVHRN